MISARDNNMEPLLTVKEVADVLKMKPTTIYHWAGIGHIPAIKLRSGKRKTVWRFSRAEIEAWVEQKKQEGLGGLTRS